MLRKRDKVRLTSDREAAEAPLLLELAGLTDGGLGRDDDRVEDEAVLETLDLADHLGLLLDRAVVVDHTNTTKQSHVNGHVGLGDGVHGRRGEGSLECDITGKLRGQVDLGGGEANVTRQKEEVVVCLTTHLLLVQQVVDRDTILGLVLLEKLEGLGGILDLDTVGRHGADYCVAGYVKGCLLFVLAKLKSKDSMLVLTYHEEREEKDSSLCKELK
jgi:hypothetical protein